MLPTVHHSTPDPIINIITTGSEWRKNYDFAAACKDNEEVKIKEAQLSINSHKRGASTSKPRERKIFNTCNLIGVIKSISHELLYREKRLVILHLLSELPIPFIVIFLEKDGHIFDTSSLIPSGKFVYFTELQSFQHKIFGEEAVFRFTSSSRLYFSEPQSFALSKRAQMFADEFKFSPSISLSLVVISRQSSGIITMAGGQRVDVRAIPWRRPPAGLGVGSLVTLYNFHECDGDFIGCPVSHLCVDQPCSGESFQVEEVHSLTAQVHRLFQLFTSAGCRLYNSIVGQLDAKFEFSDNRSQMRAFCWLVGDALPIDDNFLPQAMVHNEHSCYVLSRHGAPKVITMAEFKKTVAVQEPLLSHAFTSETVFVAKLVFEPSLGCCVLQDRTASVLFLVCRSSGELVHVPHWRRQLGHLIRVHRLSAARFADSVVVVVCGPTDFQVLTGKCQGVAEVDDQSEGRRMKVTRKGMLVVDSDVGAYRFAVEGTVAPPGPLDCLSLTSGNTVAPPGPLDCLWSKYGNAPSIFLTLQHRASCLFPFIREDGFYDVSHQLFVLQSKIQKSLRKDDQFLGVVDKPDMIHGEIPACPYCRDKGSGETKVAPPMDILLAQNVPGHPVTVSGVVISFHSSESHKFEIFLPESGSSVCVYVPSNVVVAAVCLLPGAHLLIRRAHLKHSRSTGNPFLLINVNSNIVLEKFNVSRKFDASELLPTTYISKLKPRCSQTFLVIGNIVDVFYICIKYVCAMCGQTLDGSSRCVSTNCKTKPFLSCFVLCCLDDGSGQLKVACADDVAYSLLHLSSEVVAELETMLLDSQCYTFLYVKSNSGISSSPLMQFFAQFLRGFSFHRRVSVHLKFSNSASDLEGYVATAICLKEISALNYCRKLL